MDISLFLKAAQNLMGCKAPTSPVYSESEQSIQLKIWMTSEKERNWFGD